MDISSLKYKGKTLNPRNKVEDTPVLEFEDPFPQQIETRKEVILAKARSDKHVWLADIESRIKPNEQLRVLVADDTENDRMVICSNILNEFPNAIVDEADNGKEAFDLVQEAYINNWRYDLVFMDMNMTGCDGPLGISMIRGFEKRNKIHKKTNICAVSGDDFEDPLSFVDANLTFMLKKPISLELIRRVFDKVQSSPS